jgi:hypothetical protein
MGSLPGLRLTAPFHLTMRAVEWLAALLVFLLGVGILALVVMFVVDVLQRKDAVRRNFPVIGRFRGLFERLGDLFRQYFFALDREEMPFNRAQREWVYRAGGPTCRRTGRAARAS